MPEIKIPRCYDSHLHLIATGEMSAMLDLKGLKSFDQLRNKVIEPSFFRGDWLVGFGWDQHLFPGQEFPSHEVLDRIFPDCPVAFSRIDGHALWVNTKALKLAGLWAPIRELELPSGAKVIEASNGWPQGILLDRAMDLVFAKIPPPDLLQTKKMIQLAQTELNLAGFTHCRDMSGPPLQWEALAELEEQSELSLYVEQNFTFESEELFASAFERCLQAKKDKRKQIRARGIKFYLDGALGSEGAAISANYAGTDHSGFLIWSRDQVNEWVNKAWEKDLEVSVHAIGDRASDLIVDVASKLWDQGIRGHLNIEHAQVMNPKTLAKLKNRSVHLYFQPCHWLSDRAWLSKKIPSLQNSLFLWRQAHELGVKHFWGSDTPIEKTSLSANYQALLQSRTEIPVYPGLESDTKSLASQGSELYPYWWSAHSHPDPEWGKECYTVFDEEQKKVSKVIFKRN